MKAGEAYNVIPESVTFGGTYRSMTTEGLFELSTRIKEVRQTLTIQEPNLKNNASSAVPCVRMTCYYVGHMLLIQLPKHY